MNEQNNLEEHSNLVEKIQHRKAYVPNNTKLLMGAIAPSNEQILYYHQIADSYFTFPEELHYLD